MLTKLYFKLLPVQCLIAGILFTAVSFTATGPIAGILAPRMGALGIWISNPIGITLTLLLSFGYACVFNKGFPKTAEEWMLLRDDFGVTDKNRLDIAIRNMDDVMRTAEQVEAFCEAHGMDERTSYYSALCMEEMTGNVVDHGFTKDNKKDHMVEARVVCKDGKIMLRLKDDCVRFDPMERAEQHTGDPFRNVGLKMVTGISDEMLYQHMMGLNVLTIRI